MNLSKEMLDGMRAHNAAMNTYTNLMNAVRILAAASSTLSQEDGPAVTSPSWVMVHHAQIYLTRQADAALRGVEVRS